VDAVNEPAPVAKQPMPTPTRVAVILLALLAVLLLATAVLTWFTQEAQIDAYVDAGTDRDTAAQVVLLYLIAFAVIGLTALLAAVFLPRRRAWARQVGILVTSLLVVMSLIGALSVGGISPVGLFVLIAAIAGLTSLFSRQTKDWVHGVVRER
jgi:predicted ribosomally synthesized peptide with SipW-like signal peptide